MLQINHSVPEQKQTGKKGFGDFLQERSRERTGEKVLSNGGGEKDWDFLAE